MSNVWKKMGIELEGGWINDPRKLAEKVVGAKFKTDSSVIIREPGIFSGEIITTPHLTVDELTTDVKALYPQIVNDTCGYHIHASFTPEHTSFLTTNKFWKYFGDFWEKWGEDNWKQMDKREQNAYTTRMEGKRLPDSDKVYCAKKFIPEQQLVSHEDRYTQVNFVAYSKYKTVELRHLPMFSNPELATKAILSTAEMYQTFLTGFSFDPVKLEGNLKKKNEVFVEEFRSRPPSLELQEETFTTKIKAPPQGEDVFYKIDGAMELMYPWSKSGGRSL